MGLTSEAVRNSSEYQTAKGNYANSFKRMQDFNQHFVNTYKNEYAEERRNRRK